MLKKAPHILYVIIVGLFFIIDRIFKYIAYYHPHATLYLWKPWIGWEYFPNTGVAFGIPLPSWLIITLTPPILLGLYILWEKTHTKNVMFSIGTLLLVSGALSNFIDRILYLITIDYFRMGTAVINIADVMIFLGAVSLLYPKHRKTNKTR